MLSAWTTSQMERSLSASGTGKREYELPDDGAAVEVVFRVDALEPVTLTGTWVARYKNAQATVSEVWVEELADMVFGAETIIFRVGSRGEILRVPVPAEMPELVAEFRRRVAAAHPGENGGRRVPLLPEIVEYFLEVALGSEYAQTGREDVIRKWPADKQILVRTEVDGDITAQDQATLAQVIEELNELIADSGTHLELTESSDDVDIRIYFAQQSTFPQLLPSYVPENAGFFELRWGHQ